MLPQKKSFLPPPRCASYVPLLYFSKVFLHLFRIVIARLLVKPSASVWAWSLSSEPSMRLSPATKQNTRVLDLIKNHGWFLPLGKGHFGFLFVCLFYINRKQKFSLTRNMVTSQSFSAASFILYSVEYYTAFRHFHIQFNFICELFFVSNVQADYEHIASLFKKKLFFFWRWGEEAGRCRRKCPQLGICL